MPNLSARLRTRLGLTPAEIHVAIVLAEAFLTPRSPSVSRSPRTRSRSAFAGHVTNDGDFYMRFHVHVTRP